MHGWHAPKERSGGGDGKGIWLKLANDGDLAVVVFLGDPLGREVVFDGGKYTPFLKAHAEQGVEPKVRFSINVGVISTNVAGVNPRDVKVFEMSEALYRDLFALRSKFGVTDWAYEVRRYGKPKDPKTVYKVLPERQLTTEEKAWQSGARLTNLRQLYDGQGGGSGGGGEADGAGERNRELAQLVGRLDRDGQQRFLERFGIRTLSELQPVLVPKAIEYLRDQARALQPGPASSSAGQGATTRPVQSTLTIGDELASAIVVDLKRLPQEAVHDWLKHCGIQRVRELPVDRLPDAKAFLSMLMKEFGPAPATDPYS